MHQKTMALDSQRATSCSSDESLINQRGDILGSIFKTPVILGSMLLLSFGTGANQPAQYQLLGQTATVITETQASHGIFGNITEMLSTYEQIIRVQRSIGLNILALASVLQVSRPTIYKWIESKQTSVRKKNQKRINSIYEIGKIWEAKQLGRLGSYLHKPLSNEANTSLFTLLKSDRLNLIKIQFL